MNRYPETLSSAVKEFLTLINLKPGKILVVGCSTSEILGKAIGKGFSQELGLELFEILDSIAQEQQIHLAIQCCEHLNRALVVERQVAEKFNLTEVSVVPVPGAGGSLAHAAFSGFEDAVVVETIQAHAGIDIGDTFIGMHLQPVAVPVRISTKQIGEAHVTFARTRPKLIGGQRAQYTLGTCS